MESQDSLDLAIPPRKLPMKVILPDEDNIAFARMQQLQKFVAVFNDESDRGLALIAASALDELLLRVLQAYLLPIPASIKVLEGAQAPIGTFSARLDMAAALGLITNKEYKVATLIRKIRNEFAHVLDLTLSYETQKIANFCRQFDEYFLPDDGSKAIPVEPTNAALRELFTMAVSGLHFSWQNRTEYATLNRPKPYEPLIK
jgi:DNA-binding MltR family transcriptional regulator